MSLSAGSLASLCNSRLSRERHPSTLLSSLNLPMDNYLRPSSRLAVLLSFSRSLRRSNTYFLSLFPPPLPSFLFPCDCCLVLLRHASPVSSVRSHHDEIVALVDLRIRTGLVFIGMKYIIRFKINFRIIKWIMDIFSLFYLFFELTLIIEF